MRLTDSTQSAVSVQLVLKNQLAYQEEHYRKLSFPTNVAMPFHAGQARAETKKKISQNSECITDNVVVEMR